MTDALCSLSQVKARIRIPDADTTSDTLLTELITDVTDWIQGFTHRRLVPDAAATYTVDVAAGSEIAVPRGIRAVTALGISSIDQPDTGGTYTTVALADVLLRPSPIDLRPGWPPTRILIAGSAARITRPTINGAKITGDFDFAATPGSIVSIAADAVVAAWGARGRPASATLGAGARATFPWASLFAEGSAAYETLCRFRVNASRGIS